MIGGTSLCATYLQAFERHSVLEKGNCAVCLSWSPPTCGLYWGQVAIFRICSIAEALSISTNMSYAHAESLKLCLLCVLLHTVTSLATCFQMIVDQASKTDDISLLRLGVFLQDSAFAPSFAALLLRWAFSTIISCTFTHFRISVE